MCVCVCVCDDVTCVMTSRVCEGRVSRTFNHHCPRPLPEVQIQVRCSISVNNIPRSEDVARTAKKHNNFEQRVGVRTSPWMPFGPRGEPSSEAPAWRNNRGAPVDTKVRHFLRTYPNMFLGGYVFHVDSQKYFRTSGYSILHLFPFACGRDVASPV